MELTNINEKKARLRRVQIRADFKTRQRIQRIADEKKLRELEAKGEMPEVTSALKTAKPSKEGK